MRLIAPNRAAWQVAWHAAPPPAKPERKRRERKPTLAGVLKQASKAGAKVRGATVAADGSVSLQFDRPAADDAKPNGSAAASLDLDRELEEFEACHG